jgi:hypothetical protein
LACRELATQQIPRRGFVAIPAPSEHCPRRLVSLIEDCLLENPKRRPTAKKAYDRLLIA